MMNRHAFFVLALTVAGCASAAANAPARSPTVGVPRYRAVHVDNPEPAGLSQFESARKEWLEVLRQHHTSDLRGTFYQVDNAGFITTRPMYAFVELDNRGLAVDRALANVPKSAKDRYDALCDAVLAYPHRSEIWRTDPELEYRGLDPQLTETSAGFIKMIVENVRPSIQGEREYAESWKQVRQALQAAHYPLSKLVFSSAFGTGQRVSWWLARSRQQFEETPSVEAVISRVLGSDSASRVMNQWRGSVVGSETHDLIVRPDLSSPPANAAR